MKRFLNYYLSMTLIASLFVVTSCGEEDDPLIDAPVVTSTALEDETTVDVGEAVTFTVNVTAPAGFNTLIVNQTVGSETTVKFDEEARPSGTTTTSHTYDFTFTPTQEHAGQEIVFDFIAVDDTEAGGEGRYTHTVIVNELQVNTFPATLLYAPAADGTTKSFFSATTGEAYSSDNVTETSEAVSPLIDFGYFYGQTRGAVIASPDDFPTEAGQSEWNTRNSTSLKLTQLNESSFNESNATSITAAFDDAGFGDNPGQVRNLEAGQVVAFQTSSEKEGGSKRGLIYVEEIKPGFGTTDHIKIIVKVIE